MNNNHWSTRVTHWFNVTPPLRPNSDTVQTQKRLVGGNTDNVLVLGVTPELCAAFPNVLAVDNTEAIVNALWRETAPTKKVHLEDWFKISLPQETFSAVVGDGSLNMVAFPDPAEKLLQRIVGWLKPGGVAAIRLFGRPTVPVTEAQTLEGASQLGWHEWRALLNMHIASTEGVNVPSKRRLCRFNELFPDRNELCIQTGWDREEVNRSMDSYKNSDTVTSYPVTKDWLAIMPPEAQDIAFVPAGNYRIEFSTSTCFTPPTKRK